MYMKYLTSHGTFDCTAAAAYATYFPGDTAAVKLALFACGNSKWARVLRHTTPPMIRGVTK